MLLATTLVPLALFLSPRVAPAPQRRASIHMGSLPAGAKVLVSGGGPLMLLTAKIAALRGFDVTAAVTPGDLELGPRLVEESAGVKYIQITGEGADGAAIDAKINEAQGLLLAIDSEASVPDSVIRVFVNPEAAPNLAHVGVMSRYLNGKGMGFIASTAKAAGNVDVWDGNGKAVAASRMRSDAGAASYTDDIHCFHHTSSPASAVCPKQLQQAEINDRTDSGLQLTSVQVRLLSFRSGVENKLVDSPRCTKSRSCRCMLSTMSNSPLANCNSSPESRSGVSSGVAAFGGPTRRTVRRFRGLSTRA